MADAIKKLAIKLGTDGPVRLLPAVRKIQLLFGGLFIVRTDDASYAWEHPYYPQFYFPKKDLLAISGIKGAHLEEKDKIKSDNGTLVATQYTIKVPGKSTDQVLLFSDDLVGKAADLRGLVKIDFNAMDQWFEEDQPIYVHPKDPFKRIDILPSRRHVKVSVDGHTLAETTTSVHLFETGLPRRFYLPPTSIDQTVLRHNSLRTQCPYKGEAQYYDVEVGGKTYENLFWYYTRPTLESGKIEGLVCPYSENVDIELDGQKLDRPTTHFKRSDPNNKPSAV